MNKLPRELENPIKLEKNLRRRPEAYWLRRGEDMALQLFQEMSRRVPAYKEFLAQHKIDAKKIKTIEDFKQVPTVDKDNYLRHYPLEMLCWDGEFNSKRWVVSATSGSTGEPFYFPRQQLQDQQYAVTAETYLRTNFQIQDKSTLYIVAFPMGAWIGGVFTYEAVKLLSERGDYNLSVITPGIHKTEIINAFKQLAGHFDQVIIGSYAPFLKDVLDDGIRAGIDWTKHDLGFVFSAEIVSEKFRDYVARKTGAHPLLGMPNHYGTVDMGTMAHETPLAILMRQHGVKSKKIYQALFSEANKLPTLAQYLPELFYFESNKGELYCSAYSGIPLVRYDLKDRGDVFTLSEISTSLKAKGLDIHAAAEAAGITSTVWNLPFVYVYERSDLSVSFFAFQVYPETVRRGLQDDSLEEIITGKFTMEVDYNGKGRQRLIINIEMKSGVKETKLLKKKISSLVRDRLLAESSEYSEVYKHYGDKIAPEVVFWPYEDDNYFKPGAKQKWVKRN